MTRDLDIRSSEVEREERTLSPIFVTGYMHSGTTLLQNMLGKNSVVFIGGGETRHYSHLSVIKAKYPDLTDGATLRDYLTYLLQVICTGYARVNFKNTDADALDVIAKCGLTADDIDNLVVESQDHLDHADLLAVAYRYLASKAGKSRWLDKSPSYIWMLDEILKLQPKAKVIDLVRDPRDILASKRRRAEKKGNYNPVWDVTAWRSAVCAGDAARAKYPNCVMRVRYEDLVSDPRRTIRQICEFTELEIEDQMLSVGWINTSNEDLRGRGIGTEAIGRWHSTLFPIDVLICQNLARKEMAENNYLAVPISKTALLSLPAVIVQSIGEFFMRLYKKWAIGGKDHLLNVLSGYRLRIGALKKS